MTLSEQLSRYRKEAKMTQEELAEKCDVTRQAVAKWENGESTPSIEKLITLAQIYDTSLDELVGRVEMKFVKNFITDNKRSQIKAATYVNGEMLLFYWGIGADIVEKKMTSGYGSNFYNNLSNDLKDILPDVKSFSPRNLRYMADFYEMYKDIENLQQVVAKCESENLQQVVANSDAGIRVLYEGNIGRYSI